MSGRMTRDELLAALEKAPEVYVGVDVYGDPSNPSNIYFLAVKSDVRHRFTTEEYILVGYHYAAYIDPETGDLYIN